MSGPSGVELPAGWVWARLEELLSEPLVNGRSVKTMEGGFPVLRLTALKSEGVDFSEHKAGAWTAEQAAPFLAARGDFLLSRGNGSRRLVGRGALVHHTPLAAAFPDTMIRVRAHPDAITPGYLKHIWDSPLVRNQIENSARTTAGIYKINQGVLHNIGLPLPPLAEQHHIVEALEDHLSRLDTAERLTSRAVARARRLGEAISSITLGHDVPVGGPSAPPPASAGADDGLLPDIPPSWSWKRLGDIADVVGGVTKDKQKQSDPTIPEVPYLRVANVQRGWLDLSEVSAIRVPRTKALHLALRYGDVLLNEGGDRDKLGRGWIWEDQVPGAIHQNHVFRARVRQDVIHPKLLSWYANGAARWFEVNGNQSVNLASISLSKIRQLPVPVPPRDIQGVIVERIERQLSILGTAAALSQQALAKAKTLRRALLDRAFTGRLVPPMPVDEPASVLLERVRAEHEASGRKAKRTSRRTSADTEAPRPASPDTVQQELPL
ncbi:restriction endonuclease subunit S [Actinosynnema sp. NPDC020468]|uniref:restriction endonuclease subunit S n=1 Tax=Actinosynnema sp. NPDC020468 TaxID=3154488 RepID=UPI0033F23170